MSLLEDIKYIPPKNRIARRKKTQKRLSISSEKLEAFADEYGLREWQKELVRAVDINRLNFSHIARSMGCTRQYVNQEYDKIYQKVIRLGYKIK